MGKNNIAKYTFLYLMSLLALVFSVIGVGNIIFQLINKHIVDVIHAYRAMYSPEALKFALSSLLVAAPVYYFSAVNIYRSIVSGKLEKDSGIRKWLTYLIIFVCGVVSVGWLIAIVYSVLDGDLTLKFSLKTLTVVGLAGLVGFYYYRDIKEEKFKKGGGMVVRNYFYGTISLVFVVIVSGVFFVESPSETRLRRIDNLTLEKFNKIDGAIGEYYRNNDQLPVNLEELAGEVIYLRGEDVRDVLSDEVFRYETLGGEKYRICAKFNLSNNSKDDPRGNYIAEVWPHESGDVCFTKQVNVMMDGREGMPVVR